MNRRLLVFKLQDSRYPFTSFIFRRKSFQCLFLYLCDRYTDIRLSLFVVRPLCALIKNNIIASYKRYDVSYQAVTPCRNFNSVSRLPKTDEKLRRLGQCVIPAWGRSAGFRRWEERGGEDGL